MGTEQLQILFEDNHLLGVVKPSGMLIQADRSGDVCLLETARAYLKEKYARPGNVFLGLVHRLDRNVSGAVVLARTSKAAGRLARQFREGTVRKIYWAIVEGRPRSAEAEVTSWLSLKGDREGRTRATWSPFPGAREARLRYRRLDAHGDRTLLEVELLTGRRHQIRAQLGLLGCPILGDVKYGARERLPRRGLGLHARLLEIDHPVRHEPVILSADPPAAWPWLRSAPREES